MSTMKAPVLPSKAIGWLLVSFALLLVPQWDRLPWWLIGTCLVLATWRWLAQTGRAVLPGRLVGTLIMLVLIAVYVLTVQGRFTVETAASFFVLAVGLKWLETRTSRDYYVLFFILCYLAAVNFLFQQGILWTLLNLAAIFILLVGLQILNAPDAPKVTAAGWTRLGALFLKTLPVVILLFIFFPRMSPLWSVPLVSNQARTGISDQMEPGSISSLAQSSERAFRVTFGGEIPPHRDRYWRGLILDRFVDGRWEQWQMDPRRRSGRVQSDGGVGPLQRDEYDVLLEPTYQPWAFTLEGSSAVSDNVEEIAAGMFRFRRPADTAVRYRMALTGDGGESSFLDSGERQRYLHLPAEGNPRARALAESLEASTGSDLALVQALLARFRQQPYFYTLRPPEMPQDAVDTLLFDAKRGFCAHYASATAFLLRSAGIPARVIVGYQGGSLGADDEYLIVRQYDAHAWVEAWIPGTGWIRVDPTAAISPDRIESGLRQAISEEGSFLEDEWASPQKYGDVAVVRWLSLQFDQVNYEWQRWVVGYQGQTQMNLMSKLPGNLSMRDLGYISAGVLGVTLVIAGIWTGWRNRSSKPKDPALRLMAEWQRLLLKRGIQAETSDTPASLASRAARREPAHARLHQAFARAINNHYYGSGSLSRDDHRRLRGLLRQLRRSS